MPKSLIRTSAVLTSESYESHCHPQLAIGRVPSCAFPRLFSVGMKSKHTDTLHGLPERRHTSYRRTLCIVLRLKLQLTRGSSWQRVKDELFRRWAVRTVCRSVLGRQKTTFRKRLFSVSSWFSSSRCVDLQHSFQLGLRILTLWHKRPRHPPRRKRRRRRGI